MHVPVVSEAGPADSWRRIQRTTAHNGDTNDHILETWSGEGVSRFASRWTLLPSRQDQATHSTTRPLACEIRKLNHRRNHFSSLANNARPARCVRRSALSTRSSAPTNAGTTLSSFSNGHAESTTRRTTLPEPADSIQSEVVREPSQR